MRYLFYLCLNLIRVIMTWQILTWEIIYIKITWSFELKSGCRKSCPDIKGCNGAVCVCVCVCQVSKVRRAGLDAETEPHCWPLLLAHTHLLVVWLWFLLHVCMILIECVIIDIWKTQELQDSFTIIPYGTESNQNKTKQNVQMQHAFHQKIVNSSGSEIWLSEPCLKHLKNRSYAHISVCISITFYDNVIHLWSILWYTVKPMSYIWLNNSLLC